MRTVLLVPRRADNGHRDRLWAWCKARWEALMPDVPVIEGHHESGPFNRSAAINEAARLAGDWDVAVVIDADVFVPIANVRAAIASAAKGTTTWAHRRWRGISEYDTGRVAADYARLEIDPANEDLDLIVEKTTPISWSCCVAIPRAVFDHMGGFDERFRGWGFEDGAMAALIRGLYPWARIEGDIYHLWHPRSEERIVKGQPALTASPDYIRNALLGRRYQIAVIRDHKVGDQPGEEHLSDEMAAIHVRNLTKDDARFLGLAKQMGMPEAGWTDWWPTLEELNEGAQGDRSGPSASITVIVRSGGSPENWPARQEYLRRSLASLTERVSGPIVQRVVYSDWGDRFKAELEAIAHEFGFYVVGAPHHSGYAEGVMRGLWSYIPRRVRGNYVFLAEDDFIYDRDVDLAELADVLDARPTLSQVALLRHPAYQSERDKGGILGWPLESFTPQRLNGHRWLEHRNFWTANPSLIRPSLTRTRWPAGSNTERRFADALFRDTRVVSAFWGEGEPQITHIGDVRAGTGY